MVPKIHTSRSFEEVTVYLLRDKKARTQDRVEWVELENMRLSRPEEAWKQMSKTVEAANTLKADHGMQRGRSRGNPACHLSLSWAKDESPDKNEMLHAGREALRTLGLETHQALLVCHNDEPQPHIHILVNRVSRENGLTNTMSRSKRKLSEWAMNYELGQGQVRCETRVENNKALKQGKKPRHRDTVINEAWENSQIGAEFQKHLAEGGYTLARGNRRIVIVDRDGKAMNPTRQLHGIKAADIKAKLADLDIDKLPDAEDVRAWRKLSKGKDESRSRKTSGERKRASEQDADATQRPVASSRPDFNAISGGRPANDDVSRHERNKGNEPVQQSPSEARTQPGPVRDDQAEARQERHNAFELALLDRTRQLEQRHWRQRDAKNKELSDFYRLDEKRHELKQLESKPRLAKAEKRQMNGLRMSLADVERRIEEARAQLNYQQEKEREDLKLVQQRQRDGLGPTPRQPAITRQAVTSSRPDFNQESLGRPGQDERRRQELLAWHEAQRLVLEQRHRKEREDKEPELTAFYGIKEKRLELDQLQGKQRPSKAERQQITGLRMGLADAERREREARSQLRYQQEQADAALELTQQRELEALEREIASQSRSPAPPKQAPRRDKEQRHAGNDNGPLAAMTKRHEEEQLRLEKRQQKARTDLQEQLEQRYRLKEKSNELEQLELLERPSIEQQERLDDLRQDIADAGRQADSQWYSLTLRQGNEQTRQELRHKSELAELEHKLSLTDEEREQEQKAEQERQAQGRERDY